MKPTPQMSAAARERMADMLPGMLASVRSRRRRRKARNAGLVAAAALLLGLYLWPSGQQPDRQPVQASAGEPGPVVAPAGQAAPSIKAQILVCEVVGNVPDIRQHYVQAGTVPPEWFVDDDGLQQFLRQGQRPEGIIRIAGRAMVAAAALDPFPVAME